MIKYYDLKLRGFPHTLSAQVWKNLSTQMSANVTSQSNDITYHKHNPHMPASPLSKESQHQPKHSGLKKVWKLGNSLKAEGTKPKMAALTTITNKPVVHMIHAFTNKKKRALQSFLFIWCESCILMVMTILHYFEFWTSSFIRKFQVISSEFIHKGCLSRWKYVWII